MPAWHLVAGRVDVVRYLQENCANLTVRPYAQRESQPSTSKDLRESWWRANKSEKNALGGEPALRISSQP